MEWMGGGGPQPWNEGQPPRKGKKMKASAAGEGVVLAKIKDGMAASAAGPNQALVSQCSLVVLRDTHDMTYVYIYSFFFTRLFCIGTTIRTRQEIQCLPFAGFIT